MKTAIMFLLLCFVLPLSAQTCDKSNTSVTVGTTAPQLANNVEHTSGSHSVTLGTFSDSQFAPSNAVAKCTYTHGSNTQTNCNTQCEVINKGSDGLNPLAGITASEGGKLSTLLPAVHAVAKAFKPGLATATNSGAKCTAVLGAGAASCNFFNAGCTMGITISGTSVTVTNTNGTALWTDSLSLDNDCGAIPDPQNTTTTAGGGGGPPPPCAPPEPDVQFTSNGGNESPDCEPLIIDVEGHGFRLTNTANGVVFDIRADGRPLRIPWTANDDNAFLVLDRNGNGVIDDGTELFSNVTPQPASTHKNGFLALAEYDKPANGGNGDGVIDDKDAIFSQLRLWVDANHDGISQSGELHTLHELGVYSVSLEFGPSHRVDEFGNEFLYKARVNQGRRGESEVGRTVYDVFFVTK